MALLQETEAAITDLSANRQRIFGAHYNQELAVAVPGVLIGEVPYDPAKHLPSAIHPFSLMELVAERPYVRQVIPRNPLDVNIVVHNDYAQQNDPDWMTGAKLQLNTIISRSFEEILPVSDRIHTYIIGARDTRFEEEGVEYIDDTADPAVTAKTVAEICRDGLTMVFSTFKNLPLEEVSNSNFTAAVAVKSNHLFEVELQPDVGKWATGDKNIPVVNTAKRKELNEWNKALKMRDELTKNRLGNAGLAVSQVIFDPRHKSYGFDVEKTDKSIASALRGIGQ